MSNKEKKCDVKGCNNTFEQTSKGRLRLTKKKDKGEIVAWICPPCGEELEGNIKWRKG